MTSGVTACMFELIGVAPARYCRIFVMTREASATVAPGRRRPIELTQSTRFVRARIVMTWCLLVGSASQSLAKQTIFCPVITTGALLQRHHAVGRGLQAPGRVPRTDDEP